MWNLECDSFVKVRNNGIRNRWVISFVYFEFGIFVSDNIIFFRIYRKICCKCCMSYIVCKFMIGEFYYIVCIFIVFDSFN